MFLSFSNFSNFAIQRFNSILTTSYIIQILSNWEISNSTGEKIKVWKFLSFSNFFFWISPISSILPFNDSLVYWPYPISFKYYPIGKSTIQQGKKSRFKIFWVFPISSILPFNDSTVFWPYGISFRCCQIGKSTIQQGKNIKVILFLMFTILPFNNSTVYVIKN